jgi:Spermidine/putrescine-binding periplasmic protein
MRRLRALLGVAATALLASLLLAGCGRQQDEPLRFWAMGREAEVVATLLPEFERESGIRVEIQQVPGRRRTRSC